MSNDQTNKYNTLVRHVNQIDTLDKKLPKYISNTQKDLVEYVLS